MRDLLTVEVVVTALLTTSFTCVGLLALWAATSPRHWFVRTAVVIGVLSPLLIVPAPEPFFVLILQCGVVTLGTLVYRRLHMLKRQGPNSIHTLLPSQKGPDEGRHDTAGGVPPTATFHFSLATLLLCTVLAAIAAAIAVHFPRLNLPAWSTMLLHGVSSGIATLDRGVDDCSIA